MNKKGFIKSSQGQWAHPGKKTLIPNAKGKITMKGVNYPVLGIDDQGNQQMMLPQQEYQFPGNSVYEIPMAQHGIQVKEGYVPAGVYPKFKNDDGSYSNEVSVGINIDGEELLLPSFWDGKRHTDEEAVARFRRTGEHLGAFKNVADNERGAQLREFMNNEVLPYKKNGGWLDELQGGGVDKDEKRIADLNSSHSEKWNNMQSDMVNRSVAAGMPYFDNGSDRLSDAIKRSEAAGYKFDHFTDNNDPTGDRTVSIDIENLTKALKDRLANAKNANENIAITKELQYWEGELNELMSADEWNKQTGEDDPNIPKTEYQDGGGTLYHNRKPIEGKQDPYQLMRFIESYMGPNDLDIQERPYKTPVPSYKNRYKDIYYDLYPDKIKGDKTLQKGGWLNNLPKAQKGLTVKSKLPVDNDLLNYYLNKGNNPQISTKTVLNKPLAKNAEGVGPTIELTKPGKEYTFVGKKKVEWLDGLEDRKSNYLNNQGYTGLRKGLGQTMDNFPPAREQEIKDELHWEYNNREAEKIFKTLKAKSNDRTTWVDKLDDNQRDIIKNSKYGYQLEPSAFQATGAGLAKGYNKFSPASWLTGTIKGTPGVSKNEFKEASALDALEILNYPGTVGANAVSRLGEYGKYKNQPLFSGQHDPNRPYGSEELMNPLNWTLPGDIAALPQLVNLGVKGVKNLNKAIKTSKESGLLSNAGMLPKVSKLNKLLKTNSNIPNITSNSFIPSSSKTKFAGVPSREIWDSHKVLDNLRTQGKYWDDMGAETEDFLHPDLINYHGTYVGRPVVEVRMPNGESNYFYKSTGWAGKKNATGNTKGVWQPYGGHANDPSPLGAKNWFIKDASELTYDGVQYKPKRIRVGDKEETLGVFDQIASPEFNHKGIAEDGYDLLDKDKLTMDKHGYETYYGSKTFKNMTNNLDNALINKYGMPENELNDFLNFQNRASENNTFTPSTTKIPFKQNGGWLDNDLLKHYLDKGNISQSSTKVVSGKPAVEDLFRFSAMTKAIKEGMHPNKFERTYGLSPYDYIDANKDIKIPPYNKETGANNPYAKTNEAHFELPDTDITKPFVDPNTGEVNYWKMLGAVGEGVLTSFSGAPKFTRTNTKMVNKPKVKSLPNSPNAILPNQHGTGELGTKVDVNNPKNKKFPFNYGSIATPVFEGKYTGTSESGKIKGDWFDLNQTGYTNVPAFNNAVKELMVKGQSGKQPLLTNRNFPTEKEKSIKHIMAKSLNPDGSIDQEKTNVLMKEKNITPDDMLSYIVKSLANPSKRNFMGDFDSRRFNDLSFNNPIISHTGDPKVKNVYESFSPIITQRSDMLIKNWNSMIKNLPDNHPIKIDFIKKLEGIKNTGKGELEKYKLLPYTGKKAFSTIGVNKKGGSIKWLDSLK